MSEIEELKAQWPLLDEWMQTHHNSDLQRALIFLCGYATGLAKRVKELNDRVSALESTLESHGIYP